MDKKLHVKGDPLTLLIRRIFSGFAAAASGLPPARFPLFKAYS